jgi:hypothetical protein
MPRWSKFPVEANSEHLDRLPQTTGDSRHPFLTTLKS